MLPLGSEALSNPLIIRGNYYKSSVTLSSVEFQIKLNCFWTAHGFDLVPRGSHPFSVFLERFGPTVDAIVPLNPSRTDAPIKSLKKANSNQLQPMSYRSVLSSLLISITTILIGTAATGADAVWLYAGLKPNEIDEALGIPAHDTHTVRKIIGDDSMLIHYVPSLELWSIQFEYNSTSVISESFSSDYPRFQPYFFLRTKDGLGKGRFESDYLIRHDVFMFEFEGAQIVRMDISEKDLTAIKNGFDLGIRYFIELEGTEVRPTNYMFSNKNFLSAIAEMEAAIARGK